MAATILLTASVVTGGVAGPRPPNHAERTGSKTTERAPAALRARAKHVLPGPRDINYSVAWRMPLRDSVCMGLTPVDDTLLWVSSAGVNTSLDPNRVLVYNLRTQTLVDSFDQPTTTEWGWRDMCRIGNMVYASDEDAVYEVSIPTRSVVQTFLPDTELSPHRAFAAVPGDSLLSANWDSRIWKFYRNGDNPHAYDNLLQIYGMAHDPHGVVWASTQEVSSHPEIAKYSYPGLALLDWTELPSAIGDASGGCEMWRDSFLLVLNQSVTTDEVICVRLYFPNRDIGITAISEPAMPWVGKPVTPTALVTNFGISTVGSIAATCSIFGANNALRHHRETTLTISGGATAAATFGLWTPVATETCRVKVTTAAPGDPNPTNNQLSEYRYVRRRYHVGGPDLDLYLWIDSDTTDPNAPTFNWVDTAGGTVLTDVLGDDAGTVISLPFPVSYRGTQYTTLFVCTNGWVRLGSDPGTYQWVNSPLPNPAPPNGTIAPFWDDLQAGGTYNGTVVANVVGTAPARRFAVTWQDVETNYSGLDGITFQVVFVETSGDIIFQYDDVTVEDMLLDYGLSATVGVENGNGTIGLTYEHNGTPDGNILMPGLAIRWWRPSAPAHDVGATAITSPTTAGVALRPRPVDIRATVRNYGTAIETDVPVICSVFGANHVERWSGITTIPTINAGSTATAVFGGWTPTEVELTTIGIYTALPGDEIPYNNLRLQNCPVYRAYCTGGPDFMGYRWIDSDTAGGPAYSWSNIMTSPSVPFPSTDDAATTLALPFTFYFYNQPQTSISVSTNGLFSFQPGGLDGSENSNVLLPNGQYPNYLIAPLWDNLDDVQPNRCHYATQGSAPNRVFIVSYDSVKFWGAVNPTGPGLAFQAKLYETSNNIVFQYRKVTPGTQTCDRGASACVGIENQDGSSGLTYENNAWPSGNLLDSGRAIRFYPTHDVGAGSFEVPANLSVVAPGTSVTPSAYVRNLGSWTETFQVRFSISGPSGFSYTSTQTVTGLEPGGLVPVGFSPATPPLAQGCYTMTLKTLLGDPYPANDSIVGAFLVLAAPTGLAPNSPSTWLTTREVALDWDDLAGTETYAVQVALDPGFSAVVWADSGLTGSVATTDSLPDNHYYWRARGAASGINGNWSATAQFNVDATPPVSPSPVYPPDLAVGVPLRPTFQWTGVTFNSIGPGQAKKQPAGTDEIDYYDIQVARDTAFSDLVFAAISPTTSYTHVVDFPYSATRYWRVRGVDLAGNSGSWGGPATFTTIHPSAPSLTSPPDGAFINDPTPTFGWSPSAGANFYGLEVATDSLFASPVINIGQPGTGYTPGTSLADGHYWWRVRASADGGSVWGAYSAVFDFDLDATRPAAPVLLTPPSAAVNVLLRPQFTWTEVSRRASAGRSGSKYGTDQLDHYDIQLATDPGFATLVFNQQTAAAAYTHSSDLSYLTGYFWRVRGVDDHGNQGDWATDSFTTIIRPPAVPALASPPDGATSQTSAGDLVWHASVRAASYDVYLDFVNPPQELVSAAQAESSYHFDGLGGSVTYYWQIVARNVGGDSASAIWRFTTLPGPPARPQLLVPESAAVSVPVNGSLIWHSTAGAATYDVYLDTVSPPAALLGSGLSGTILSYSALDHDRTYYWRVVAVNAGGSTASDIGTFTTIVEAPPVPVLRLPADGTLNVATSGALGWFEAARAEAYDVYLDDANPPVAQLAAGVAGLSQPYESLANSRTYYWYVVAGNAGGQAQSAVWSFTTIADIPGGWTARADTLTGTPIKDGGALTYDSDHGLIYSVKGNKTLEFHSYSPLDSAWTRRSSVPAGADARGVSKGAALCYGGGFVYVMKGNNTREFYRYSVLDTAWQTTIDSIPAGPGRRQVKAGGGLTFVQKADTACVYVLKGYGTEFYRYVVAADSFEKLADAPTGNRAKYDKGSWIVYDGSQYIYALKAKYNELHRYDIWAEQWVTEPGLPPMPLDSRITGKNNKKAGDGSCATWDGSALYALKGNNTQQFWKYLPGSDADTWIELESVPQAYAAGLTRKKVKSGAGIVYVPFYGVFYAHKGNKTNQLWRYKPGTGELLARQPLRDGALTSSLDICNSSLGIFPNPLRSGLLTISLLLPRPSSISIYDPLGRIALTRALEAPPPGPFTLDLRSLPSGIYIVRLDAGGFTACRKLVVEH